MIVFLLSNNTMQRFSFKVKTPLRKPSIYFVSVLIYFLDIQVFLDNRSRYSFFPPQRSRCTSGIKRPPSLANSLLYRPLDLVLLLIGLDMACWEGAFTKEEERRETTGATDTFRTVLAHA